MEAPSLLEHGNIPPQRKSTCSQVAFNILIFVLIIILAVVSTVFCLIHHKQAPASCWAHGYLKASSTQNSKKSMSWEWSLKHCNGFVQGSDQYLIIEHSGNYFIYGQVSRKGDTEESFTLMLHREPSNLLLKAVGNRMANFARPFHLNKGDKLYCEKNSDFDSILLENQTYWGLFNM